MLKKLLVVGACVLLAGGIFKGIAGNQITSEQYDDLLSKYNTLNAKCSVLEDVSIKSGTGIDSLVQTYSGDVDSEHYESTCPGESSASFGEANNVQGKRDFVTGKMNYDTGSNDIMGGLRNTLTANNSILTGSDNASNLQRSIVTGCQIDCSETTGSDDIIVGEQHKMTNATTSIVVGDEASGSVYSSALIGNNLVGNSTPENGLTGKLVLGTANESKDDTLIEVGQGYYQSGELVRTNVFEVTTDGRLGLVNYDSQGHVIGIIYLKVVNGQLVFED